MPIVPQGTLNTTALSVPNLYVQIVPPQNLLFSGVPSNVMGVVGSAIWGPVNQPVVAGTNQEFVATFGQLQPRKFDLGTAVYIAVQQGASAFRCVRQTDGTDIAASAVVQTNCLTLTGLWTGSLGNSISVTFLPGTQANTTAVQVTVPGYPSERFDNIVGTGAVLWGNIAKALTTGAGTTRGASAYVVAVAGAGTASPALNAAVTLNGGTDGASGITSATLVGQDSVPRTGMYALRGQGCAVAMLADADDSTQWVVQGQFGLSEAVYMVLVSPAGSAIKNGSTGTVDTRGLAGLDTYAAKLMHGDWCYWYDQVNRLTRLVSPQAFVAGRLANLSPEQSSLNKPLIGIVATQKSGLPGSGLAGSYSDADLSVLFGAKVDVISNPAPGGQYWAVRRGCNSSSNPGVDGDNYTRLTNYLATSIASVFGIFIGEIINPSLFRRIKSAVASFLGNMAQQGMISSPDGSLPYAVTCDLTNNPAGRTGIGYVQCDVQVQYGPIALFLILNLEGGQTVQIKSATFLNGQQIN